MPYIYDPSKRRIAPIVVKEKGRTPRKPFYTITIQKDPLTPAVTEKCIRSKYDLIHREWDTHIRSSRTYPVISDGVARLEYIDDFNGSRVVLECSEKRIVDFYATTGYEEYITCHLYQYPFYKFPHHYRSGGHWHLEGDLTVNKLDENSFYYECHRKYGFCYL